MSVENIPGSNVLLGGNGDYGYLGTVTASEFITGDALASLVGLSSGTSQHSTTDWLKFVSNGKIIYSPMKTIRNSITWNAINNINCIFGDRTVKINNLTYKVRLFKGSETNPANPSSSLHAINSEWVRLMFPIHEKSPSGWGFPFSGVITENWGVNFSDNDLLTHGDYGKGSQTWCQESSTTNNSNRIAYGYMGVHYLGSRESTSTTSIIGWRPVLELVDYTFDDLNSIPTISIKNFDSKPITQNQSITIPTETPYQFKITASDEDTDQTLQYKVSVGGVNTISLTSIERGIETTETIDKSQLTVGMNAVVVTVVDSEGAETTFQFNIIVDANLPIDSSCLANMKFNGYSLSTISLAELVNHLE